MNRADALKRGAMVPSQKNGLIQHIKDVISNPTPTQLIQLMRTAAETMETHPATTSSPPSLLVEALRSPAGTPQTIGLGLLDLTLVAVIFPYGKEHPAREAQVWSAIIDRLPEWRSLPRRVKSLPVRQELPPELGGVMLREAGVESVTSINEILPHKQAIDVVRALRLHTIGAAILAGGKLLERAAHRHPLPAGLAAAATVLTIAVPAVRMIPDEHPGGLVPVETARPPTAATVYMTRRATVTVAAPTVTVTETTTNGHKPEPVMEQTVVVGRPVRSVPTRTAASPTTMVERSHAPHATGTPTRTASPETSPTPSPTPVYAASSAPSSLPSQSLAAEHPAETQTPAVPVEASQTAQPAPTAPASCGLLDVDVDLPPLAGVDVCIG